MTQVEKQKTLSIIRRDFKYQLIVFPSDEMQKSDTCVKMSQVTYIHKVNAGEARGLVPHVPGGGGVTWHLILPSIHVHV